MSSSLLIGKSYIHVPRYDKEFVEQAARHVYEVLGLELSKCCSHIVWLEKDHQGISEMCKSALIPIPVKKTNQDYLYSMLTFAVFGAVAGIALNLFKLSMKIEIVMAFAFVGLAMGWYRVYSASEQNMKETEIRLKAATEKNWLRSKLPQITEKLKAAEEKIAQFKLEDFDKAENKDDVPLRDQLLLLKSYVEKAVGPSHD